MVVQTEVHPEAQFQNPAPIKPQDPMPSGVHEMEVSWDRNEGYMRVVVEGQKWWFKEIEGKAVILGTDNAKGRWNFLAKARLTGELMTFWRPSNAPPHPKVLGTDYPASYQRLCYRRFPPKPLPRDWRVRDERKTKLGDPNALVFVTGYVGDLVLEWEREDTVAHLYHKGPWTRCDPGCFMHPEGGWGHFYEA